MATFSVPVVKITKILPIEGADKIELAQVLGYQSVVGKGQYKVGDLAAYIPEGSIVPLWLLQEMGLEGKLAGPQGNRVKIAKLRNTISQGLLYPIIHNFGTHAHSLDLRIKSSGISIMLVGASMVNQPIVEALIDEDLPDIIGSDVSEMLGITKYEPEIPTSMSGEVCNLHGYTLKFDVENYQRYPNVLIPGEPVRFSSKLHGTFCAIAIDMALDSSELLFVNMFAYSKGLGDKGLVFKNVASNTHNIYHATLMKHQALVKNLCYYFRNKAVHVLGEVFGMGIQDLHYGLSEKSFRVFDIYIGQPGSGEYLSPAEVEMLSNHFNFELVPELYKGPFDPELIPKYRDIMDPISGKHIQEGLVIRLEKERRDDNIGRVMLKAVSPAYLLRKNKNATEYQ